MKVYLVYETDEWLSLRDRQLKGVFTSKRGAVSAIVKNNIIAETEKNASRCIDGRKFNQIIKEQLAMYNQTQSFSVNYMIEETELSKWL